MDRCEQAVGYHKKGFNCCQSVLAAFQDVIGLTETQCLTLGGGFGAGAGTRRAMRRCDRRRHGAGSADPS